MAAGTVRQFAAFGAAASVGSAPTNVYFLTGSQSNLWVNNNRPNLYRETNSTQFKDARWFNGGGTFDSIGYIVGANTSLTPTTDGGGSDSYVFVWGFDVVEQSNITLSNFINMASYVTGTSYSTVAGATAGLTTLGYYYGYQVDGTSPNDFRETNLSGAQPG
jgi:hypothetical protein